MQNLLRHLIRVDQHIQKSGTGGGYLLTGGGAVGGGQVEEGVHLVGLGLIFTMQLYRYWLRLCSYHPSGIVVRVQVVGEEAGEDEEPCQGEHWQGGRCLARSLSEDVETYQVSSSVQSRKATSSTVNRPGIWLADSRKKLGHRLDKDKDKVTKKFLKLVSKKWFCLMGFSPLLQSCSACPECKAELHRWAPWAPCSRQTSSLECRGRDPFATTVGRAMETPNENVYYFYILSHVFVVEIRGISL